MNTTPLKAEMKLISREPVLVLFMLIPIFIFVVFKVIMLYLLPLVFEITGFEFVPYYGYLLSVSFLMTPGMTGTVVGFLMIDERDCKIFELMSVMPSGYSGYITNRLVIPFTAGIMYTLLGYLILNIYTLNFFMLLYIAILTGLDGMMIGLLLFSLADDKVKGLTYSKALGTFDIIALADLLQVPWVSAVAALCPFYWITRLIVHPEGLPTVLMAAVIHFLWLGILLRHYFKLPRHHV